LAFALLPGEHAEISGETIFITSDNTRTA